VVRSGKKDQAIEAYEKAAQFNPATWKARSTWRRLPRQGKLADAELSGGLGNGESGAVHHKAPWGLIGSSVQDRGAAARTLNAPWTRSRPGGSATDLGLIYKWPATSRAPALASRRSGQGAAAQYATIFRSAGGASGARLDTVLDVRIALFVCEPARVLLAQQAAAAPCDCGSQRIGRHDGSRRCGKKEGMRAAASPFHDRKRTALDACPVASVLLDLSEANLRRKEWPQAIRAAQQFVS